MMDRLADAAELLDGPLDHPDLLAGNLRDLRRINHWLGGAKASGAAVVALAAHRAELALLDVGTGGADIPMALLSSGLGRGQRLSIVAIDHRPEIVALARQSVEVAALPADRLDVRLADGRQLPFPDRSFDVAHASLLLHHLEPDDALELLREMGRVARLGVVINDLERSRVGWLGAWLVGHLLTGNRLTRHDAPLSVRRAYTATEAAGLLRAAGLVPVATCRATAGLRYAISAVAEASGMTSGEHPAEHPYDSGYGP